MAGIGMPVFTNMMRTSGANAGARQVADDITRARSLAIQTGWEYRIFGGNAGGSKSYKNRYRMEGRSSIALPWPLESEGSTQTSTKMVGEWVNFDTLFNNAGVSLNAAETSDNFSVAFTSRGFVSSGTPSCTSPAICAFRVTVTRGDMSRTVTVSNVGAVKIQ
jgi:Tfp pilus assembly protein FimT